MLWSGYRSNITYGPLATAVAMMTLQVCDSVVNIGPIADVTLGEPGFVSVSGRVDHVILIMCVCVLSMNMLRLLDDDHVTL